ncbi:glycoside hydrolase family 5 protein [Pseudobacteriovorax antillogorgiicola]|uniref:Endoglucanase n=1 Tax=Pseudobacteriovorax antillogorgiicola TaxID=1513793 RepID=A0A1Y6BG45_9BACT|nr:glycoside hydrolase family 5 protein [Pseudobacteriovorax antillogorgiicola]TCS57327.1 endoglucanase [Pseudobacteriovorax antillogorgiicola]SMF02494.1 endoglucanase [Pseudobacteriovorax antillogorgiicola]
MKKKISNLFKTLLLGGLITSSYALPVLAVEPLTVQGRHILSGGQIKSYAGASLFWSNDGWEGEKFYNSETVSYLKSQWQTKLVRAAMGVELDGGYLQSPKSNKDKVIRVVDAAIANNMYVIIDWHSHHAEAHPEEAVAFFQDMARRYGSYPNVIYEIYNEPLKVSWTNVIKPYAERVIAAIRAIDPDNLIIVGTPTWSQDVDIASRSPITGFPNIAYALHFYAGTHGQSLRDKAAAALANGIALFATEWGTVNANGDGAVAYAETEAWMDFLARNHISHANWAINDKREGASALVPTSNTLKNWQLTESGSFVRDIVLNWNGQGGDPIGEPGQGDGNDQGESPNPNCSGDSRVLANGATIQLTQGSCFRYQHDRGELYLGTWDSGNPITYAITDCDGQLAEIRQTPGDFTRVAGLSAACQLEVFVKQASGSFTLQLGSW